MRGATLAMGHLHWRAVQHLTKPWMKISNNKESHLDCDNSLDETTVITVFDFMCKYIKIAQSALLFAIC